MIIGIGTDIVAVSRVERLIERFGDKFALRILSEVEYEQYHARKNDSGGAHFLAKLFAAKEAGVKALGTGFAQGVCYQDVCVNHTEQGKPVLQFTNQAEVLLKEKGMVQAHLSISDEEELVIAFVVLDRT